MANHVSHRLFVKGCRYTVPIPRLDADGDPTAAVTPDTEVSIDNGGTTDCVEEATAITDMDGAAFITLTGDETNGSLIAVAAKVGSGPKTTLLMGSPDVFPVLLSGTATAGGNTSITLAAGSYDLTGCIIKTTGGTGGAGGSGSRNNQARRITAYNDSTLVATVEPAWETNPASGTEYEVLLTEMSLVRSIGGLTADAANKIADHVKRRTQANTEASSDGDTLDLSSQYGAIQQIQESSVSGGTLTVKKTDGSTTLGTKIVTADASANPVTGIS